MGLISAVKAGLHHEHPDHNAINTQSSTDSPVLDVSGKAPEKVTTQMAEADRYATQNAPVVQETVKRHEREEIQPIIEREREETHVNQVIQPINDSRTEVEHHHAMAAPIAHETIEDVK
ncbi:hypothetical protein HK104_006476 [Borealophlyctis nickersoniae]|nr:hypothetical protein HK104_006476 [Borealophlyctis nickersoniae]